MKKFSAILLSLFVLLSLCPLTVFAAEENDISQFELPAPQAPNYFLFSNGNASEASHDELRMFMVADPEVAALAAEYDRDSEAFCEKYGLWYFDIVMQYDVSLDGEDNWQHTSEWDTQYNVGGYADGFQHVSLRSELMEEFGFFWLTYYEGPDSDTFVPYKPAIITEKFYGDGYEEDIYSFDTVNHSLYIRCRYYMEWEPLVQYEEGMGPGEKQSKFSDWSESAVFGKNSTQIIPEEPTVYEAPVVSDLKFVEDENGSCYLEYSQTTPESVWLANIYYIMYEDGQFDGLETQVSINGGEWVEFNTADADGDWCLSNGIRCAYNSDVTFDEDDNIKLRIRFTGTHGPSAWSNVAEINAAVTPPPATTYTVTVVDGTASKTNAEAGETITLTANSAPAGKVFDKWVVNGTTVANAASSTTTFTMPAANVTATATYKDKTVTPPVSTPHSITVINGEASVKSAAAGTTVTLTAEQIDGKVFTHWEIIGATVADDTAKETSFTMGNADVTAEAIYEDCSCKCHNDGILGFLYRIIIFFQKLFGKNITCELCGAKH